MSLSTLPLSYCTNVHPGMSMDEVVRGVTEYTAPTRRQLGAPLAAGLWLAQPVTAELKADPQKLTTLRQVLADNDLVCYTLNAFPYGNFHSERVKEEVYRPDWSEPARLDYTRDCAKVLAELMPEGVEGSISTVPLGFKQMPHDEDFLDRCIDNLLQLARGLDDLHDETGRVVRLAVEPEPLCVLETTDETLRFFERLRQRAADAAAGEIVDRHIGVCYDVCHQSVEFEDAKESIGRLHAAGVRINKVHITCAIRLVDPANNADGREALASYVEPRYLHQTFARGADGRVRATVDLARPLCEVPPPEYLNADEWRVHFHVPVNAERLGPLETTRDDLQRALKAVAALEYAPHLEVETYTWAVLPGQTPPSLVDGLTAELTATRDLLAGISSR